MRTFHIHIKGIVQGVGFRPFVFKSAQSFSYPGWVKNTVNGVHIKFNVKDKKAATSFYQYLLSHAPRLTTIEDSQLSELEFEEFFDFQILTSEEHGKTNLPLTPDFAICDDCRAEIREKFNRRLGYSFTTCTHCGPRYSIINMLPYDRPETTMNSFVMCDPCQAEYHDSKNRRHFSQTNSCTNCGIHLGFFDFKQNQIVENLSEEDIIIRVAENLKEGKIIAVKGIGGFLLLCDAQNKDTIVRLREQKHRPSKPFAVLYPSIEAIEKIHVIREVERKALTNEVGHIVLLGIDVQTNDICYSEVVHGLDRLGVMLPYAPLLQIIIDQVGFPLIATSANISGSPIIYTNETAISELGNFSDGILFHDREILIPQDDSVIGFTNIQEVSVLFRRSRGLAPNYPLRIDDDQLPKHILATGAHMKGAFALKSNHRLYISQYIGELGNYLSQVSFEKSYDHLKAVVDFHPNVVLSDAHPGYFTSEWAQELADQEDLKIEKVPHHRAHFASVLFENGLLNTEEKILGVIWDGTGFGEDGNIWGGEFFTYENHLMERVDHLTYSPIIGGDKMSKEPRLTAFCLGHTNEDILRSLEPHFTVEEWSIFNKEIKHSNMQTSSMGRLFDAVACLILKLPKISYEGEAAMKLEVLARKSKWNSKPSMEQSYVWDNNFKDEILQAISNDLIVGMPPSDIAYRFHVSLVSLIIQVAKEEEIRHIAFSGGVFQNMLLIDLLIALKGDTIKPYFHQHLSPNDECIALGQLAYTIIQRKSGDFIPKKSNQKGIFTNY